MFRRSTLIMLLIGGGISTLAFGFSLLSVTKINLPPKYEKKKFSGKIETVNDIEDLEFANGCKFYFYDTNRGSSELEITGAREFRIPDNNKKKMFEEVKKWADKNACTEGRLIYISEIQSST